MEKMKPGIKTTEFWLTLAANVIGATLASGVLGDGTQIETIAGAAMMLLAGGGYTYGRAKVKAEDSRRNGHASNATG